MPFIHIVLLPVSPDAPSSLVSEVVAEINALKTQIPGVRSISCGKTVTARGKQYTHALVAELDSQDSLPVYAEHPAHQAVLSKIKQIIAEEAVAIDYPI